MMTDDIDDFIRNQKSKLRQERQSFGSWAPPVDPLGGRVQQPQLAAPAAGGPRANPLPTGPAAGRPPYQDLFGPGPLELADNAAASRRPPSLPPRPEDEPEKPLVEKMGSYEERRRRMNEERAQEYQRLVARDQPRRRGPGETSSAAEGAAFLPGAKSDSAKVRAKVELRNREYQVFKEAEEERFRNRMAHKKPPPGRWGEATPRARTPQPPPQQQQIPLERPPERRERSFAEDTFSGELERWQELLQQRPGAAPDGGLARHASETRLDELEREVERLRRQTQQRPPEPIEEVAAARHARRRYSGGPAAVAERSQRALPAPPLPPPPPAADEGGSLLIPERRSALRRLQEERQREYNEHLQQKAAKEQAGRSIRFRDDSPRRDDDTTQRRYFDAVIGGHVPGPAAVGVLPAAPTDVRRAGGGAAAASGAKSSQFRSELMKLDSLDSLYDNARAKLISRHDQPRSEEEWLSPRTVKDLDGRPPRGPNPRREGRQRAAGGLGGGEEEGFGMRLGRQETGSAQQRKKEQYRLELAQQIEEAHERARREKAEARQDVPIVRSLSHTDLRHGGGGILGTSLAPARSTGSLNTLLGPTADAVSRWGRLGAPKTWL